MARHQHKHHVNRHSSVDANGRRKLQPMKMKIITRIFLRGNRIITLCGGKTFHFQVENFRLDEAAPNNSRCLLHAPAITPMRKHLLRNKKLKGKTFSNFAPMKGGRNFRRKTCGKIKHLNASFMIIFSLSARFPTCFVCLTPPGRLRSFSRRTNFVMKIAQILSSLMFLPDTCREAASHEFLFIMSQHRSRCQRRETAEPFFTSSHVVQVSTMQKNFFKSSAMKAYQ